MTATKRLRSSYSRKELSELLDVTTQCVDKWISNGLTCKKVGKHKVIETRSAVDFFNKNRLMTKHAMKLMESVAPEKVEQIESQQPTEMEDLPAMLGRARVVEIAMFELFKNTQDKSQRIWAAGIHREALDARRKLEKDISDIQLSQQTVMPMEEVSRKFSDAAQLVKNRLQMLPDSISDRLVGLNAVEINKVLTAELELALEDMSK